MGKFANVKIDLSKIVKMTENLEKELKTSYKGAKWGYLEGEKHRESGEELSKIALVNNFGDPADKIPPRPFMTNARDEIAGKIPKIVKKRIEGGESLNRIVIRIARDMQTTVKRSFTAYDYEPNAPATVRKKGKDTPLLDTFQLQNSVRAGVIQPNGKLILLPPDEK